MMAEIVNLKLHRKRKARADKDSEAAVNRAKFGRAKIERQLTEANRDHEKKRLDDHKLKE